MKNKLRPRGAPGSTPVALAPGLGRDRGQWDCTFLDWRAASSAARRGLLFLPHTPSLYAQIDLPLCAYFARHVLRRMLQPVRLGPGADEA